MRTKAVLLAAGFCLALSACSFTAPRGGPGYANLDSPGVMDTDREMSISLGRTILRFAANHIEEDPETVALLRSLDGIRIRIYEIDGSAARVAHKIDRMQISLQDDGWLPVMLVREDNERTQLMLRATGSTIHGLTLITSDGTSEAVVINLIGDIAPEHFSDVMVALDIDDGNAQDIEVVQPAG